MNDIEKFKSYNLAGTTYDYINCYVVHEHEFVGLNLHGNLNDENCEYKHFDILIGGIKSPIPVERIDKHQEGILKNIVVEDSEEDGFHVHMTIVNCEEELELEFICKICHCCYLRYRDVDYTNVYGSDKYNEFVNAYLYLEDEQYFSEECEIEIGDGISLIQKRFLHEDGIRHSSISINHIKKDGNIVYSYRSIGGHHTPYKKLIHHKNGHRYYPHHIDLYGISYIDIDTLEVFHYIPKGRDSVYDSYCGESFIITGIYYDIGTNLVAYEGCYWAGTSDVMVGDLTNPLSFNPKLISIHEIVDPEYEEMDDVDFYEWKEESLSVKLDMKEVREIDIQEIFRMIDM